MYIIIVIIYEVISTGTWDCVYTVSAHNTVICLYFVVKIFSFPVHRTKIVFMKINKSIFCAGMKFSAYRVD